jgi:hypothetical protein
MGPSTSPIVHAWKDIRALRRAQPTNINGGSGFTERRQARGVHRLTLDQLVRGLNPFWRLLGAVMLTMQLVGFARHAAPVGYSHPLRLNRT